MGRALLPKRSGIRPWLCCSKNHGAGGPPCGAPVGPSPSPPSPPPSRSAVWLSWIPIARSAALNPSSRGSTSPAGMSTSPTRPDTMPPVPVFVPSKNAPPPRRRPPLRQAHVLEPLHPRSAHRACRADLLQPRHILEGRGDEHALLEDGEGERGGPPRGAREPHRGGKEQHGEDR